MNADPVPVKRGDKCPNCDDELVAARVPTDEQRRRAADRENPTPLPAHYDTATVDQRDELGELFRCRTCGYATRFPLEKKKKKADAATVGN